MIAALHETVTRLTHNVSTWNEIYGYAYKRKLNLAIPPCTSAWHSHSLLAYAVSDTAPYIALYWLHRRHDVR